MTQIEFARTVGLSQTTISRYESGLIPVPNDSLDAIAQALEFPSDFFRRRETVFDIGSGCDYFHRKRADLGARALRAIYARANVLRIQALTLLEGFDHRNRFKRPIVEERHDPERVAYHVREEWGIARGPVPSVVDAIEKAGGIVFCWPFGTSKLDAISQWPSGQPPFFFVNADAPGDRLRYTVAHELGHILMHTGPKGDMEREADRFAAEFLMPGSDVLVDMAGMTLTRAAELKPRWGVSMAAIIRRSRDLKCLSENDYKNIFIKMSQMGIRTTEPYPILREKPSFVKNLLDYYINEKWHTISSLCKLLATTELDLTTYLAPGMDFGDA